MKLKSCTNLNKGLLVGLGRVYLTYLQPERLLANPPLQVIANGARCELKLTEEQHS
ncbi:hypothetical protein QUA63_17370 [Microcoleus sp. M2_D2]|uniref:hypothetical protein n=1 Tax=Microcoleus sp. M2-A5 TaxID=2818816 RepID=UPI002FD72405